MQPHVPITILTVLVLLGVGWFVVVKKGSEKPAPSDTNAVATTTITLDYSKLTGKDRLYTEEEGKYENLSEEEKKLLRVILTDPDCIASQNNCWENESIITRSPIIALKNDMLLLDVLSGGKVGSSFKIYDIKQKKLVGNQNLRHFGTQIRNDDMVIYVAGFKAQKLLYYRPGMTDFAPIPKSDLPSSESYWYRGGMGSTDSETSFTNNTLKLSIFREGQVDEWDELGEKPNKLREVTIDLATLP